MLAALFVIGVLGPLARYSITAFFPALTAELHWTRSEIGTAQSISLWVYSVFSIFTGWMIDHLGSRKTIFVGGLLCLGGWLLLATIGSLWQLYVYYGVVMAIAVSNSHLVPIQSTARKWLVRRAGLAAGIVGSAFAFGTAAFSPLLTSAATTFGWRAVSVVAAFATGIPILLLAYFVVRDTPESIGQQPDGAAAGPGSAMVPDAGQYWGVRDALRTPQLWLLFVSYSALGVVFNGLMAHLVIWGVDLGSTAAASGIYVTLMNGPSIIARVGGGWLADRYGKRLIMIIGATLCVLVMLLAWAGIHSTGSLAVYIVAVGIIVGFAPTTFAPYLGDLYGRRNVGSLFGVLTLGWGLVGGLGPLVWGLIRDGSGSYSLALPVSAGCYALALAALLLVRPVPARPRGKAGGSS
jgi:MFS family permease